MEASRPGTYLPAEYAPRDPSAAFQGKTLVEEENNKVTLIN